MAAADGTETIQSVDQPAKFVRIDGAAVTLATTGTPVRRVVNGNSLKLKAADGRYLRVLRDTVTLGPDGTTFRLG